MINLTTYNRLFYITMKFKYYTLIIATITLVVMFNSCSKDRTPVLPDDPEQTDTCSDNIKNGDEIGVDCGGSCSNSCEESSNNDLNGSITGEVTLDATITYSLTGALIVESNATLIIPEGTLIISESGPENYIFVKQDGDIVIQGSSDNPVVMSSTDTSSYWGGLKIAGKATSTDGEESLADFNNYKFAGNTSNDNSGNIQYLIIKNAGATNSNSINHAALALYAVGSGTTINNVAFINNQNNGLKYFGGSVSATNLYFEDNSNTSFSWDKGWNGTQTNTLVHNTLNYETILSGFGENLEPNFVNFTALAEHQGTAMQFNKNAGALFSELSLIGFEASIKLLNNAIPENILINGNISNPLLPYISEINVDESTFDWVGTLKQVKATTLSGDITTNLELSNDITYYLKGKLSISNSATLTVPAGTTIIANIEEGDFTSTYIVVQKNASININGTAANPVIFQSTNNNAGDWGGLIVAGNATTSNGANAVAEVGNIIYGGADNNDNSGTIEHLIILGSGAKINPESEFNGLSLYAVGSETTINNVAILNGNDDGIELFGGTVSINNVFLENNADDAIDWTEGWGGSLTNVLVHNTISEFSSIVEADGVNNNPQLENFTAISQNGGIAFQFNDQSGATVDQLSLLGFKSSVLFPDGGDSSNVTINDTEVNPELPYISTATVAENLFDWVDDKAIITSTVLTGEIIENTSLDATMDYYLHNKLSISNGATFTIPEGTKIIADVEDGDETDTFIVIQKGSKIQIEGTAANPVLMTSASQNNGDWGGLIIAGNALTTKGANAITEVGDIAYGGNNISDNSGSIEYLILKYAGAQIDLDTQFNGISLYAVGSSTNLSNIAIMNCLADGVAFFGGSASITNLYLKSNNDDAIDWTEGWNGSITNTYVEHDQFFSSVLEGDGNQVQPTFTNLTAVSTADGTSALQFKNDSGAIITGLSLDGYNNTVLMVDHAPYSNVTVDGTTIDPNLSYENASSISSTIFDWISN